MNSSTNTTVTDKLSTNILDIFAQVTRYPIDILDPQANLEEDLGIDSVKLGEVFAVLREKFKLPMKIGIPPEQMKTISGITEALQLYLSNSSEDTLAEFTPSEESGEYLTISEDGISDQLEIERSEKKDMISLSKEILVVFEQVTRYPSDILDPDANLEEDLGVDSVKLGEVFAVLREKYDLPQEIGISPEDLKSIAGITSALFNYLSGEIIENDISGSQVTTNNSGAFNVTSEDTLEEEAEEVSLNASNTSSEITKGVLQVFADVTRYPNDILDPHANLEEDLGIDSVKLGEVFAVLRERYDLPQEIGIPPEQMKTIAGITSALVKYLNLGKGQSLESKTVDLHHEQNSNGSSNGIDRRENSVLAIKNQNVPNGKENGLHEIQKTSFANLIPSNQPFKDKVAFISGSGRGLGKEIAVYLASLGASVIINSFHSKDKGEETFNEIKQNGGKAHHIWGSMANPAHVDAIFREIESRYEKLDFFISNASNGMLAKLEDITPEHWEKAFRTNIIGLQQGAVRALQLMKKNGGGKIITLSSPASHGYVDYFGCMGAVKAAVESLTRSMAIEFAPYNVSVNCVSPGPIYGELLKKWPESERLIKQWEDNTAYDRLCEARDVAHFIAYLLSDPVKIFTGSILVMDGGISSQGW